MFIEILGETMEFPNNPEAVPEITQVIDHKLSQARMYFSHFSINGVKRYDELEIFLHHHIADTERIEIIGCTLKELADDALLSAVEYLTGAIPVLTELASQFYQEPSADSWQQLEDLLEGLEWLFSTFTLIDREIARNLYIQGYPNWNEYLVSIYSLKEIVIQLGQAMESQDTVLMGDLINYEVIDLFKQMKESLNSMLPWEV